MSKRWTQKELDGLDDITFAMCILSERRGRLDQNAPLAKKLASAYHALDKLRGGQPIFEGDAVSAISERIYHEMDRANELDDILCKLNGEDSGLDLHGLTKDQVVADSEIINRIRQRLDKCGTGGNFWDNVEFSIENGIADVLEARKGVAGRACIHFKGLGECHCNNDPDDPGECVYESGIEPPLPAVRCKYYTAGKAAE